MLQHKMIQRTLEEKELGHSRRKLQQLSQISS